MDFFSTGLEKGHNFLKEIYFMEICLEVQASDSNLENVGVEFVYH
jgi:hypothetical protein